MSESGNLATDKAFVSDAVDAWVMRLARKEEKCCPVSVYRSL